MTRGKLDQFLDQFVVLTGKIDLVDDFADSPKRPQLFNKRVTFVAALFRQAGREVERLFLSP